jgi:hypothetical protein
VSYFADGDIPDLLSDAGEGLTVTFEGDTVPAIRDETDEDGLDTEQEPIQGTVIVFVVQTGSLSVASGEAITASDGGTYTVKSMRQIEDGALTRLICLEGT